MYPLGVSAYHIGISMSPNQTKPANYDDRYPPQTPSLQEWKEIDANPALRACAVALGFLEDPAIVQAREEQRLRLSNPPRIPSNDQ